MTRPSPQSPSSKPAFCPCTSGSAPWALWTRDGSFFGWACDACSAHLQRRFGCLTYRPEPAAFTSKGAGLPTDGELK